MRALLRREVNLSNIHQEDVNNGFMESAVKCFCLVMSIGCLVLCGCQLRNSNAKKSLPSYALPSDWFSDNSRPGELSSDSNDSLSRARRPIDRLWKQGYGYNNPNIDRIGDGRPRFNFDGSRGDGKSAFRRFACDFLSETFASVVVWTIEAAVRSVGRKIRR